ncbi:MAG TPA: hypothetical protein VF167_04240 [Longimicrobiaceae bacterium]
MRSLTASMASYKLRSLLLLLGIALVLPACRRSGGTQAPAGPPPPAPLAPTALLYYDNSGGIQDSLRVVIRDAEEFERTWRRATSTQSSPPPMPTVAFDRAMVLLVAAGRMKPDDVVRVDSVGIHDEVTATGERERVMQVIVRTVRGCGGFSSDAYPLALVQVARFEGPVRFTERSERAAGCAGAALIESRPLYASKHSE